MGSLKIAAGWDVHELKQRSQLRNPNSCAVALLCFDSSKSGFGFRFIVGKKKAGKQGSSRLNVGNREKTSLISSYEDASGLSLKRSVRLENFVVCGLDRKDGSILATRSVNKNDGNLNLKNPVSKTLDLQDKTTSTKNRRKIWNRFQRMQKASQQKVSSMLIPTSKDVFEKRIAEGEIDAGESNANPDSSMEHCNSILKRLEKRSEEKTVQFFEWMRQYGKVGENIDAYCLVLRALARKEDWSRASMLIQEMTSESLCELDVKVFNPLIYVCAKRGLVGWGTKWFHMMLEKGIDPNVATIGMLMALYQKKSCLSQAEFAFGHMRRLKLKCIKAYSAMITICTRLRLYHKSEDIIRVMNEEKILPDTENWLVRLNAYCQQGKTEEAEAVLKSMLETGMPPNIIAYNTLITGYGRVANMKAAKHLFQNLESVGLNPDETTYRSMVEGFGRTDNYEEALWYYEKLKSLGFHPNSSNFYTLINLQAKYGDVMGTTQTLEDMRIAGCQYSSIVSSLLQAYEKAGRIESVPQILEASFYQKILLDATSCSILAIAYVKNSLIDDALRVLKEKKWEDTSFEENLYHLLICSCKESSHYENAVKIYLQMSDSRFNQNLHITCSMIDIYSAMDRFNEAEKLYLKLKDNCVTLDMIAYSIVVRMYIRAGSLENACVVLEMMEKEKNVVPDTFLFRDMLRTYQQCGMTHKLANVYYWILKSGVVWDEAMYNCVINCCARALPVDELSRLFEEMMRNGCAVNTITFNVMLDVYGKTGMLKKAWKVFCVAHKQGLADVISYNTIIAAYGKSKDFQSMETVIDKMQSSGHPVSLEAYNCLLDAYGKDNRLVEFHDILRKMKEAQCISDHYTYNIMINIYGTKGWIKEVACVLAELKNRGLEPDLYSYNTLIKAYGIAGMVEEAVNVVQEMRSRGIRPDRITYSNLITSLQKNESFLEAVKWSLWMKQMESHSELCPS
ncbi:pentatricopeptide repeat-containing protein At4g30825, chloroplastic-like [Zingiber officinale]|uniref:pentatricopeptide repeat-containing protein At4g30825, chloroplastic-like n=1 Tax=Zingiber officinale TaxID=94328 RepID=UPI001C4A9FF7|nr:pentatricopeptide repeat-containing protein At4g30825, chloroplastic-like [Zingiber officinale]XP_042409725.1 pentatricopeptide repeat-containing protein At4g30825, chloroplastic-like [Zingiber officinale]